MKINKDIGDSEYKCGAYYKKDINAASSIFWHIVALILIWIGYGLAMAWVQSW